MISYLAKRTIHTQLQRRLIKDHKGQIAQKSMTLSEAGRVYAAYNVNVKACSVNGPLVRCESSSKILRLTYLLIGFTRDVDRRHEWTNGTTLLP